MNGPFTNMMFAKQKMRHTAIMNISTVQCPLRRASLKLHDIIHVECGGITQPSPVQFQCNKRMQKMQNANNAKRFL